MQSKNLKYLIVLILVFFMNSLVSSQNNVTDAQGRKQGEWMKYKNGIVLYKGTFKDDYPIGEFNRFYPSGNVKMKSLFSEKGQKRFVEFYYDQWKNTLKAKGLFVDKKKDSVWVMYNNSGVKITEETYDLGVAIGIWKLYDYTGVLVKETPYTDGHINGIQKNYFENGNLSRSTGFTMEVPNGEMNIYYPSSSIRISGTYNHGFQEGDWTYYSEDGEVLYIETYKEGVMLQRLDSNGDAYEIVTEQDTIRLDVDPSVIDF